MTAFSAWVVLASLAIAGFAAFSPDGSSEESGQVTTTTVQVGSEWGSLSGRVAAMALVTGLETGATSSSDTYESYELDFGEPVPTTTTTPTSTTTTTTTTTKPQPQTTTATTQPQPSPTTQPAPPPDTTSTTTTVPSSFRASVEQWRGLVGQYFNPEDVNLALKVIDCESGGEAAATNERTGAGGLFQHLFKYWDARAEAAGWAGADVYDPEANIAVAAHLVYSSGWHHWGACV
ncbi:MAG: transglycosylase SLT domain-containing protein [Acidimicrobiia bacterium]